jgi:hypothetical protein
MGMVGMALLLGWEPLSPCCKGENGGGLCRGVLFPDLCEPGDGELLSFSKGSHMK